MTFSPSYSPLAKRDEIPTPVIDIRELEFNSVSAFDGSSINGTNQVWIRTPDFDERLFSPANQPVLEMGWFRRSVGGGRGRWLGATSEGITWPDDADIKFGADQGGGNQTVSRKSKWLVDNSKDFRFVTGARIELEHYFRSQRVHLLSSANVFPRGSDPITTIRIPTPTFVTNKNSFRFTNAQFDLTKTVPRYQGYQNAYFVFAFSVKDPDAKHPGDRIRGPISDKICVSASTRDAGFPIWPRASGYADGIDSEWISTTYV